MKGQEAEDGAGLVCKILPPPQRVTLQELLQLTEGLERYGPDFREGFWSSFHSPEPWGPGPFCQWVPGPCSPLSP